jgi:hypothetical protein
MAALASRVSLASVPRVAVVRRAERRVLLCAARHGVDGDGVLSGRRRALGLSMCTSTFQWSFWLPTCVIAMRAEQTRAHCEWVWCGWLRV